MPDDQVGCLVVVQLVGVRRPGPFSLALLRFGFAALLLRRLFLIFLHLHLVNTEVDGVQAFRPLRSSVGGR